jgi:hypothetical protein
MRVILQPVLRRELMEEITPLTIIPLLEAQAAALTHIPPAMRTRVNLDESIREMWTMLRPRLSDAVRTQYHAVLHAQAQQLAAIQEATGSLTIEQQRVHQWIHIILTIVTEDRPTS